MKYVIAVTLALLAVALTVTAQSNPNILQRFGERVMPIQFSLRIQRSYHQYADTLKENCLLSHQLKKSMKDRDESVRGPSRHPNVLNMARSISSSIRNRNMQRSNRRRSAFHSGEDRLLNSMIDSVLTF